jgi:hypothetical protein
MKRRGKMAEAIASPLMCFSKGQQLKNPSIYQDRHLLTQTHPPLACIAYQVNETGVGNTELQIPSLIDRARIDSLL